MGEEDEDNEKSVQMMPTERGKQKRGAEGRGGGREDGGGEKKGL